MRKRIVHSSVVHVAVEVSVEANRVLDGTAVWIKLLVSLVAVTERGSRVGFDSPIIVARVNSPLTHHAATCDRVHVGTHVGTHRLHVVPRRQRCRSRRHDLAELLTVGIGWLLLDAIGRLDGLPIGLCVDHHLFGFLLRC
jgi:hypothetical protein